MKRNINCNNCGKSGHISKKCNYPIISVGIIAIKCNVNINDLIRKKIKIKEKKKIINSLKYVLIKRKHTMSFISFIRGKYNLLDVQYIMKLFNHMTKSEIDKILKNDFDLLWNDLWTTKRKKSIPEYEKSKKKYYDLINGLNIKNIINIDNCWDEQEWEFPKGKRKQKETNIDCASREFVEETNIDRDLFEIIHMKPINEVFTGLNGMKYKYIYYIAQINDDIEPSIDDNNKFQNMEVSDIKCIKHSDILKKIRNYSTERKEISIKIHKSICSIING